MNDCIFCKIIKGEIPSYKIYEDESFVSFLDINPVSKGHALIIPKNHIEWMHEAEDNLIKEIFVLTKKMMLNIKENLQCDYVQVSVVGKDVPHFHVHLIPRNLGDDIHHKEILKYKDGEVEEIINKIAM
jgi:histidine triad (HIT) family protein